MTAITASGGFSIGRVVQRMVDAIGANLGPFLLISALLGGLPTLLSGAAQISGFNPILIGLLALLIVVLQIWGTFLLQAALIIGAMSHMDGERSSLSDWVSKGLKHWWRVFLVDLLAGLIIGAASMLLFVPGVVMATRYVAATPALICENLRVNPALARSAKLTAGRRWAIFGLFLLYVTPIFVAEALLVTLAASSPGGFVKAMGSPLARLVLLPAVNTLIPMITAVGAAALYAELRIGRESAGSMNIAKVFD